VNARKLGWTAVSLALFTVSWVAFLWFASAGLRYCSERHVAFFDVLDFNCYGGKGLRDGQRIPVSLDTWLSAAFEGFGAWLCLAGLLAGVALVGMHRYGRRRANGNA